MNFSYEKKFVEMILREVKLLIPDKFLISLDFEIVKEIYQI